MAFQGLQIGKHISLERTKYHKRLTKKHVKFKYFYQNCRLLMLKVKPLFETESFQDIINASKEVQNNLQSLGCFKKVDMTVDTVQGIKTQYKVNINVEEAGSLFGNIGVVSDITNTVAGVVRVGINNIGGGGEVGQVELSKGAGGYNLVSLPKVLFGHSKLIKILTFRQI